MSDFIICTKLGASLRSSWSISCSRSRSRSLLPAIMLKADPEADNLVFLGAKKDTDSRFPRRDKHKLPTNVPPARPQTAQHHGPQWRMVGRAPARPPTAQRVAMETGRGTRPARHQAAQILPVSIRPNVILFNFQPACRFLMHILFLETVSKPFSTHWKIIRAIVSFSTCAA